jgi:hypothetical protein
MQAHGSITSLYLGPHNNAKPGLGSSLNLDPRDVEFNGSSPKKGHLFLLRAQEHRTAARIKTHYKN